MARRKQRRAPARKSEPRPLSGQSSDWYWEQDAELRFTRVEAQAGNPGEQELARGVLGKRRWETGLEIEGGWDAHRKLLEARAPFREALMWRDFEDGRRRYIRGSGEPVFGPRGRFAGYRGVGRDITRQKRGEELLRLQHLVTRRLAEAAGAAEGIEGALRAICETEGWDCGELWRLDEAAGVMRRVASWASDAGKAYTAAAADSRFKPGEGLIGAVWQSGKPLWIPDTLSDPRSLRKSLAEETGLHAALLCPVLSGARVVAGVLGFACRRIRPPDDELLEALMAFATQLGLFLRRAEAEARGNSWPHPGHRRRTGEPEATGIAPRFGRTRLSREWTTPSPIAACAIIPFSSRWSPEQSGGRPIPSAGPSSGAFGTTPFPRRRGGCWRACMSGGPNPDTR
jgi:hypothetical protein